MNLTSFCTHKAITPLSLALMVLANVANAGTMGASCIEGSVTMPCAQSNWTVGGHALYLKPTYTPLQDDFIGYRNASNSTHWYGFTPNWGWGFHLDAGYHFGEGNDVNVNWYHLNYSSQQTVLANTGIALNTLPLISVQLTYHPEWDAVNGELGQKINFGQDKYVRLFGGFQYARIANRFSDLTSVTALETAQMDYNGFGPRAGLDLSYNLVYGFSLYGNTAAGLLIGSSKYNTVTTGILDVVGSSYGSEPKLVPELEAKLGLSYAYASPLGSLNLHAGYMWQNYFNVQGFMTVAAYSLGTFEFGVNGPYFGLQWVG